MKRDFIILSVGVVGLALILIGSFFLDLSKNTPVLLALIAAFGGLLGLPTAIRKDETAKRMRDSGS